MTYEDLIRDVFSQKHLLEYIKKSLNLSLRKLGFSEVLISDLTISLTTLDVDKFIKKHDTELEQIQIRHFFHDLVPKYFSEYVVPEILTKGKVLDLGCGFGTLIQILKERGANSELVGIDIKASSNWEALEDYSTRLEVVSGENFLDFIKKELPEVVVLTWVLHHMEYDEQERYLEALSKVLPSRATIVILEDSYAVNMKPESGQDLNDKFMLQKPSDRQKVMGALDWIANRILSKRITMPVPFSYRTLEDWKEILEKVGFQVTKMRFLGFPENRDVSTPQSIIVARK